MNLPKSVGNYIVLFAFLVMSGILFANIILVLLSIVPFVFIMAGFLMEIPDPVAVQRVITANRVYTDDLLKVTVKIHVQRGFGTVALTDVIPKGFQLVGGNNFIVMWKGFGEKAIDMTYTVKCVISGEHRFDKIIYEARHGLYDYTVVRQLPEEQGIEVVPRILALDRLKGIANISRIPMPLHAFARIGIPTLEFNEIRSYTFGDSFKYINWKASSRNIYRGGFWPVINEYEKEGRKAVWIFLDGSDCMELGTNLKTVQDHALEAVCQLAYFYIKQQCSTAFCMYNVPGSFISPGMGNKQYYKILNEVMQLSTAKTKRNNSRARVGKCLEEVIVSHRGYLEGTKPLFIIITSYSQTNHTDLAGSIREMAKYSAGTRELPQVLLVNVNGYNMIAETASDTSAAEILSLRDQCSAADLRKRCIWVDWDPTQSTLFHTILQQVG
jgi:uncharacterized protein (DUF58 family)